MYLHQDPVCKEGNIKTCSRGKGSCPEGYIGGWGCRGCRYNSWDDFVVDMGIGPNNQSVQDYMKSWCSDILIASEEIFFKALKRGRISLCSKKLAEIRCGERFAHFSVDKEQKIRKVSAEELQKELDKIKEKNK